MSCGDHAELSCLVILKCLHHLVARVHDEWPEPGDRFLNRESAKDQPVECWGALVMMLGCFYNDAITCAIHGELPRLNANALCANSAATREGIDERIEVGAPRQVELGTRLQRCVHQRDRRLCRAGPAVSTNLTSNQAKEGAAIRAGEQFTFTRINALLG